jgi:hypothetical protein
MAPLNKSERIFRQVDMRFPDMAEMEAQSRERRRAARYRRDAVDPQVCVSL